MHEGLSFSNKKCSPQHASQRPGPGMANYYIYNYYIIQLLHNTINQATNIIYTLGFNEKFTKLFA